MSEPSMRSSRPARRALFAVPRDRPAVGAFARLDAAAAYVGLTEEGLRLELERGMTLADVARERGRPVGGLVDVLVAPARALVDDAAADGRMTHASAKTALARAEERMHRLVHRRANFFNRGFFGVRGVHGGVPTLDPAA